MGALLTGGCQCGAVRYHTTEIHDNVHICHCRMCQKAVGNIFAALVAAPDDAMTWTRGKPSVFRSSERVERGFCSRCGTPLFVRTVGSGRTDLTIGSLDAPAQVPPRIQYGIESRLEYFAHLHELPGDRTTEQDDPEFAASVAATNHQHPDHDTETWPPTGGRPGEG